MPLLLLQLPGLPSRNAHSLHLLFGLFGPSKFIPFMYQAATCSGLFSDPLLNHQETVCEKELTYSTHARLLGMSERFAGPFFVNRTSSCDSKYSVK